MTRPVRKFGWEDAVPGLRSDEFVVRVSDEPRRACEIIAVSQGGVVAFRSITTVLNP
ncbi:MAG: hypothetical protein O3C10_06705 [Chloroflexi bacterium]|nr:hypothetical protein [Chloroflexota bacterium]